MSYRRFAVAPITALSSVALVSCGSGAGETADPSAANEASGAAFPVTVDTKFGTVAAAAHPEVTSSTIDVSVPRGFSVPVSEEGLDLLDADLLVVVFPIEQAPSEVTDNPLLQRIPAAADGRFIVFDDPVVAKSYSTYSVLSTGFALDTACPRWRAGCSDRSGAASNVGDRGEMLGRDGHDALGAASTALVSDQALARVVGGTGGPSM